MHGLDIIIRRNAEAAGREAGHAFNDGRLKQYLAIEQAAEEHGNRVNDAAFSRGYVRGRKDG